MSKKQVLVTGAAGFIGFHLSNRLIEAGYTVVGLDNLNPYYEISLKEARLKILENLEGFEFVKLDLAEKAGLDELFQANSFRYVVNLAAQAGVR
ncbi:MAG: NAD-dependent epimerase/dehydratase family protein, partial [Cyclobacteriaceae bacterium]